MMESSEIQDAQGPSVEQVVTELLSRGVMIEPDAFEALRSDPSILQRLDIGSLAGRLTLGNLQQLKDPGPAGGIPAQDEGVRILNEYEEKFDLKGEVSDFLNHFTTRYRKISLILRSRPELKNLGSVNRIRSMQPREDISLIGIVTAKRPTRSGHVILEIEDETGLAKVLLSKNGSAIKRADEIVEDEIIAIRGQVGKELIYAEEVVFPDVPQALGWPSRSKNVAVMISDVHIGSKQFLSGLFDNFVEWINGNDPVARRVKYLLVAGDLVDGVGVYKGQQKDLVITDIEKQYAAFAGLMDRISKRVRIFACPGNHDASRDADPQPRIPLQFAPDLYNVSNLTMVSSPATIQLDGVSFLMYHGTALDSIIASVASLRKGGYDNPHQAMIQQLRKRHLIPIYGESTRMFPDNDDSMVITKIPNVFHSGHVHKLGYSQYRGTRVVNSGTFQDRTAFQMKVGHHPQPGKVPYIELGTGSIGILDLVGASAVAGEEGGAILQ